MKDNNFIVISPVYNTKPYIAKCITSVLKQTYKNYKYLVVEDCSTDGTRELVEDFFYALGGFIVHYNPVRTESPLGNFVLGIQLCPGDPEDIIVTCDGDDWLYDEHVLEYLNEVYQDPDVWMTYGSFVSASGKITGMCKQLESTQDYRRRTSWVTSHIRTIKRWLFDRIKDSDMRDENGKYYVLCPETAYMFPAIEMAGLKHSKFLDKILYVYNDENPSCSAEDWKTKDMTEVNRVAREIRLKDVYNEITEL